MKGSFDSFKDVLRFDIVDEIEKMSACDFCAYGIRSMKCRTCDHAKSYQDLSMEDKHDIGNTSYASANYSKKKTNGGN